MKNSYSNFMPLEEMQNELAKINSKEEIEKGGIPLCYDEKSIYLDTDFGHNLVIGSTGSGKTQTTILPKVYTSILTGESLLVDDINGEIYEIFEKELKDKDYNIIKLDFNNFDGNSYNPLALPYKLYKEGNIDKAIKVLEKVAYYLFECTSEKGQDPFWLTSTRNLFLGLALYLMENDSEITIDAIINLLSSIKMDDISNLSDDKVSKSLLKNIFSMPNDTKGSVFAVFNMGLTIYLKYNNLSRFLSKSDFEFNDFLNKKIAIFIFNGHENLFINSLVSLFIEQLYFVFQRNNKTRMNILLDDFDDFIKFENLIKFLSDARSNYIELTILVRSFNKLNYDYGDIAFEHFLSYFTRMVYLYANDEFTLNYISNICGNKNDNEKLVSSTELKLMKRFEAIILKSRMLPFKTKLLPFYEYTMNK